MSRWLMRRRLTPEEQEWLERRLGPVGALTICSGRLADWLCALAGAGALTFRSWIWSSQAAAARLARGDQSARALLVHEAVHVVQYRRYGTAGFLADYLRGYLRGRFAGLGHDAAYRALPAEQEAFAAEAAVWSSAEPTP